MSIGVEQRLRFFPRRFDRVYFVSQEVGSDSNDGLSEFSAFATLDKARTVANAALPAASNSDRILIRILDGKSYDFGAGAVTLNGFITVEAPEARLTGNSGTPTVLSATFSSIEFGSVDGTDLTIKQVSGSGVGGIQFRSPSIFNADNLFNILAADGAAGSDAINIFTQSISAVGTFAENDAGKLYINSQRASLSKSDPLDIPFVKTSGAGVTALLNITDLDGTNVGAGDIIGVRAESGAEVFAFIACNSTDVAYSADGAGSEIHVTGEIINTVSETASGIVYRHSPSEGVYTPNLPATGGLALTDLIKIYKAGTAEKATLTELQTLIVVTETLAQTLAAGNVSGANDLQMTGDQQIQFGGILNYIFNDSATGNILKYVSNKGHVMTVGTISFAISSLGVFTFEDSATGESLVIDIPNGGFTYDNGTNFITLDLDFPLTANRNQQFQDADGTIALLSDIVVETLAQTLAAGNSSGANDISMDTLQGIIFGNVLRKIVDDGTNITYLSNGIHQFLARVEVKEGTGSGLAADAMADDLVVTGSGANIGISIMAPAGGNANIFFGETGNADDAGRLQFVGSVNEMRLNSGGNYIRLLSNGYLRSSLANYETLIVDDDAFVNKKYVDDEIAGGYPQTVAKAFADTGYVAKNKEFVIVDTTGGATTINLPAAATSTNFQISILKKAGGNDVTVDANGAETINGSTTQTISTQYDTMRLICDGTEWFIA